MFLTSCKLLLCCPVVGGMLYVKFVPESSTSLLLLLSVKCLVDVMFRFSDFLRISCLLIVKGLLVLERSLWAIWRDVLVVVYTLNMNLKKKLSIAPNTRFFTCLSQREQDSEQFTDSCRFRGRKITSLELPVYLVLTLMLKWHNVWCCFPQVPPPSKDFVVDKSSVSVTDRLINSATAVPIEFKYGWIVLDRHPRISLLTLLLCCQDSAQQRRKNFEGKPCCLWWVRTRDGLSDQKYPRDQQNSLYSLLKPTLGHLGNHTCNCNSSCAHPFCDCTVQFEIMFFCSFHHVAKPFSENCIAFSSNFDAKHPHDTSCLILESLFLSIVLGVVDPWHSEQLVVRALDLILQIGHSAHGTSHVSRKGESFQRLLDLSRSLVQGQCAPSFQLNRYYEWDLPNHKLNAKQHHHSRKRRQTREWAKSNGPNLKNLSGFFHWCWPCEDFCTSCSLKPEGNAVFRFETRVQWQILWCLWKWMLCLWDMTQLTEMAASWTCCIVLSWLCAWSCERRSKVFDLAVIACQLIRTSRRDWCRRRSRGQLQNNCWATC